MNGLEDHLRLLDAYTFQRAIPIAFPKELPPTTSVACRVQTPSTMPVRSLKQSVWRWPALEQVLTPAELEQRLSDGSCMAMELKRDLR